MYGFAEEENELKRQGKKWLCIGVNSNDHSGYLGSFIGVVLQGSPGFSVHTNFSRNNRC